MINLSPKYPGINVQLSGMDGNAISMMMRVKREMERAHVSRDDIEEFLKEARSGDYDNVIRTCCAWVNCH